MVSIDTTFFMKALDAIREKSRMFTLFEDCIRALDKNVVLPIHLPTIDSNMRKMFDFKHEAKLQRAIMEIAKGMGIREVVVPNIGLHNCMLRFSVVGIGQDPSLFRIVGRSIYNYAAELARMVGFGIGTAEFLVGFYPLRNNATEGMYVTTIRSLLSTALFATRNQPIVVDALKDAVMKVYGNPTYVEMIDRVHKVMLAIGGSLDA